MHISQRFGIDFSHAYQSDVRKKIVSVLFLQSLQDQANLFAADRKHLNHCRFLTFFIAIVE
jgi:hypothetical protein